MAHAESQISIKRPVHEVFTFLLDGTNNPKWRSGVLDITRLTQEPDRVGSKFKQGLRGPGGRIDGDYEIVQVKPDSLIEFNVIAGPARPTGVYKLTPSGDSTLVTFTLDYKPRGLSRLMDPVITKTMQSEVAALTSLKAYLEGQKSS